MPRGGCRDLIRLVGQRGNEIMEYERQRRNAINDGDRERTAWRCMRRPIRDRKR